MMPTTDRLPWEDRWSRPNIDQLTLPIEEQPRHALKGLIAQIDALPQISRSLTWYGPAWKWTIHYQLLNESGDDLEVLCYLVPGSSGPIICIPLMDQVIDHLPMRRLNKFIRNGIRLAKCAVTIHWAVWNLGAASEVVHLFDLVKRKHKIVLESSQLVKI